jgi:hypothetical protein
MLTTYTLAELIYIVGIIDTDSLRTPETPTDTHAVWRPSLDPATYICYMQIHLVLSDHG